MWFALISLNWIFSCIVVRLNQTLVKYQQNDFVGNFLTLLEISTNDCWFADTMPELTLHEESFKVLPAAAAVATGDLKFLLCV